MTASWLARRERPKLTNAASPGAPTPGAVLVKGHAIPYGLRLALSNLGRSATKDISLKEY